MKIDELVPERTVLSELGKRLVRVRKQQGFTQARLAEEAGVGVATLRRIEAGKDSQLESWIKLLRALKMTATLDQWLPQNLDSPRAAVLAQSAKSRTKNQQPQIKWGDELE